VFARDDLVLDLIAGIQTFDKLVHFHPHIPSPTMIAARNAAKNGNAGRRSPLKSCVSEQEKAKKNGRKRASKVPEGLQFRRTRLKIFISRNSSRLVVQ
jgi:hypothetical protein